MEEKTSATSVFCRV